jgi:riboflavin kinase / FMN adenylyltransferase
MKIFRGAPRAADRRPTALTIGNFDGVHCGHRALLERVVAVASERALVPAVMTFEPHPREFFAPDRAPARVANLRDKLGALRAAGIERAFVMHFNARFAALSPDDFIERMLVDACQVRWLLVGDDFRFGARRAGDVPLLQQLAPRYGFEVEQLASVRAEGERISSSAVRDALRAGDFVHAERLLGHPYRISGHVQHGRRIGRTLGFPTINLAVRHRLPAVQGIFAVRVLGLDSRPLPGVASLGLRPTVNDDGRWLLEVHLFDFEATVYGRLVCVEFFARLRDEARYHSLEALESAIATDAAQARALLAV